MVGYRVLIRPMGLRRSNRLLHCVTDHLPRERFLEVSKYTILLRSRRGETWIITRDKNGRSFAPFRPNPLRDVESGAVLQLVETSRPPSRIALIQASVGFAALFGDDLARPLRPERHQNRKSSRSRAGTIRTAICTSSPLLLTSISGSRTIWLMC